MKENLNSLFLVEASELLNDLEKALLLLENDYHNQEVISEVFRVMHSLKGTASMFGYSSISDLTHDLESIYDSIRNEEAELSKEILDVTLACLDHLKVLLSESDSGVLKQERSELITQIKQVSIRPSTGPSDIKKDNTSVKKSCYYILFCPNLDVLRNGTNTLYLVDDLLTLGTGKCLPFFLSLPTFTEIGPDSSYTGFEVLLQSSSPLQDIKDVFLFTEGNARIDIERIELSIDFTDIEIQKKLSRLNEDLTLKGVEKILSTLFPHRSTNSDKKKSTETLKSNIRVDSERVDELMNLVSELVTTQASLSLTASQSNSLQLNSLAENIEKITRRLRDNAFNISLVPIEALVVRFKRLIRDLSSSLGKEITFQTEGTEAEVDKSVIEKLTDPILHILRNSIDHGIESPKERISKGKNASGKIILKAYYSGSYVMIEISDDGRGIDHEKILTKARSKGMIDPSDNLSEAEILNLIFLPGFSTADEITGVSGRGVGMDVVKKNIEGIRGEVHIRTTPDKGTTFLIQIPLTLSIIDGLLVEIDRTTFVIPLSAVNKCYEVATSALKENHNNWITIDGRKTPFIFLRDEFNITKNEPPISQLINVIHDGKNVCLAIDRIIGQYQAVLKPLGQMYVEQDEYSGASILGDGSVALVMDTHKIVRKFSLSQN